MYLKAAKNCMEKGGDYAQNEIQRLERILEKVIFSSFWQ
jgi:protein disulfide-isomerase A6